MTTSRLEAAEKVCVLFGWTGTTSGLLATDRENALAQAWHDWASVVKEKESEDFLGPQAHPELDDTEIQRLADRRKTTIMATLEHSRRTPMSDDQQR